ncbi:MAG: vitamin B12-dependent ribonucleotide reductase [Candidatus Berkelbacteria bacterium]|nr:vitamin B12-dependent ribonucleotide reductase [Candidatus Berkelbacteria bacterium]
MATRELNFKTKEKPKVNLSENAVKVLEKRYLRKDDDGNVIETPYQMFERVANHLASVEDKFGTSAEHKEKIRDAFLEIMASVEYLPNSPTFTGAGTRLGQLAACFVLPIEDDMESILRTQLQMGMVHKSGGGTGFSFSRLRPVNDFVRSTGGVSCGPLGFMQMYNDTTEQIKQGGTRRGANMGILNVHHTDIVRFIEYKNIEGKLNNFNISVALTDEFMQAVKNNAKYPLINPNGNKFVKKIRARTVFKKIINGAWKNGEPGIIFIDRINKYNPTPALGAIESTNPCGEQPLLPYESCNLGSINLSHVITKDPSRLGGRAETGKKVDFKRLEYIIRVAVRLMDNTIEINKYPFTEIKEMTRKTRKIGLGVMGFADMLLRLGVPYNSDEALKLAEKIMKFVNEKALYYSQRLTKKRGPFPTYNQSIYAKMNIAPPRNATRTTIAPTGTLSIIAHCSSGIEPIFAFVYKKNILDGDGILEYNPYFLEVAKKYGFYSKGLMKKVSESGSIQDFEEIPKEIKRVFVTARDITPEWHVKMQAAFQKYTDNAVSKTINFPNSATKKDVKNSYLLAYNLDCKGLTVYREGSRNIEVLTTVSEKDSKYGKKEQQEKEGRLARGLPALKIHPRKRPAVVTGYTYKIGTSYGNLYVTINEDEKGYPFEIFTHMGKAGGFFAAKAEAISRLVSLALRSGVDIKEVIDQLKGIRDPSPTWGDEGLVLSLPDAIGKILSKHLRQQTGQMELGYQEETRPSQEKLTENGNSLFAAEIAENKASIADLGHAPACPECGAMLEMGEGCLKCPSCGFSRCG